MTRQIPKVPAEEREKLQEGSEISGTQLKTSRNIADTMVPIIMVLMFLLSVYMAIYQHRYAKQVEQHLEECMTIKNQSPTTNNQSTMPTLEKVYSLTITPEQFLAACSRNEIIELNMLLSSPKYDAMLNERLEDHHFGINSQNIVES